jgi:sugar lactone lactonase YvrE
MPTMTRNPLDGFTVDRATIKYVGEGLQRPECILAERDGTLWSADARGGVLRIDPDGKQTLIVQSENRHFGETGDAARRFTEGTLPNGLAFARNGDILISNFGTDRLEVMDRKTGAVRVLHDTIDGKPIGKVNFVLRDSKDRLWLTISTKIVNWMQAMSPTIADGAIALADGKGIRVVAEGFAFTNEIRLDAREEWLYVVETCGKRITRLRVRPDGSLGERQIFGPRDTGGFIDGIAFDAFGNLWGTHVVPDRVFAITPEGEFRILLEDVPDWAPVKKVFAEFDAGMVRPETMLACGGVIAPWMASITFGGADLRTVYVGSLKGTRIPYFRSPVAGLPMVHW